MKIKKWPTIIGVILVVLAGTGVFRIKSNSETGDTVKIIYPHLGSITNYISTTGTVLPKNRLEIKPPVNGRIEQVLVKEGDTVRPGQVLALMSSTERAALLDAARGQGEEKLKYWEEVYKPIPLIAPIDGEVIVGTIQPGQTITTSEAAVVLSDRLIVRAQVDETDIGKVKRGQKAIVSLDAYPDTRIEAAVDHIYFESKVISNVTIYEVDLLAREVPDFFRSGMSANIDFIQDSKEGVLILPLNAVNHQKQSASVLIRSSGGKTETRAVVVGLSDGKNIEIVSGLNEKDAVMLRSAKYLLPQGPDGRNPFAPQRRR